MNKIGIVLIAAMCGFNSVKAQQVPKQIVVEHFTNTYCSVCHNRNPGFYNNLKNFQEIIHIAYHPSSPYAACPINQLNKEENDARTNYYGVYGGTPRLVLQGVEVPGSTDYAAPSLFQGVLNKTSSFSMTTSLRKNNDSLEIRVVLKKADTSSLTDLNIYAVVIEDTLNFIAHNGETLHQDVFRKSFVGSNPISIVTPSNVGDSTVFVKNIAIAENWNLAQMYAVAIIADSDKALVQSSRSSRLESNTTGIGMISKDAFEVFPNPTKDRLYIKGLENATVDIFDYSGRMLKSFAIIGKSSSISLTGLSSGSYILKARNAYTTQICKFICE